MKATQNHFLKSFSGNYTANKGKLEYGFGLAYAERAPSVSEGHVFYLYNFYDYIGNPNLKKTNSMQGFWPPEISHKMTLPKYTDK